MSDDHYGEGSSIEQDLTRKCQTFYDHLVSRLPARPAPKPTIAVVTGNDEDSHYDHRGIFLHSQLAEEDPNDQVLTICRLSGAYLQYYKNKHIRNALEEPDLSLPRQTQVKFFVGTVMTYASLLGAEHAAGKSLARNTAEHYRMTSRSDGKRCLHAFSLWYGADAYLKDIPFSTMLGLWSTRCLNKAKLTHLEGVEPYLAHIKEAARLENDGFGV